MPDKDEIAALHRIVNDRYRDRRPATADAPYYVHQLNRTGQDVTTAVPSWAETDPNSSLGILMNDFTPGGLRKRALEMSEEYSRKLKRRKSDMSLGDLPAGYWTLIGDLIKNNTFGSGPKDMEGLFHQYLVEDPDMKRPEEFTKLLKLIALMDGAAGVTIPTGPYPSEHGYYPESRRGSIYNHPDDR